MLILGREERAFLVYFEAMTALWWSFVNIATQCELNRTHWRRALQGKSKGNWPMNLQLMLSHDIDGFFPLAWPVLHLFIFPLEKIKGLKKFSAWKKPQLCSCHIANVCAHCHGDGCVAQMPGKPHPQQQGEHVSSRL